MHTVSIRNESRGLLLAGAAELANRPWSRLRGLLGRAELAAGAGLIVVPCHGVHTLGMRFAIDALYLDRKGAVLRLDRNLPPGAVPPPCRGGWAVVEIPAGAAGATAPGDRVRWGAA